MILSNGLFVTAAAIVPAVYVNDGAYQDYGSASGQVSVHRQQAIASSSAAAVQQDTVRISIDAMVKQLSDSGQNNQQIAANLGLTAVEVQMALGESPNQALDISSLTGMN